MSTTISSPATSSERATVLACSLEQLKDLSPTPTVNYLFNQLVTLALNTDDDIEGVSADIRARLQHISSCGETALETYWAKKIIDSSDPWQTLARFPYLSNYRSLTELEWHTLRTCTDHKRHSLLFVGGGSLPLTAIMLAKYHQQSITVIDSCASAAATSQSVINALNLQDLIQIKASDVRTFDDVIKYNAIWVAALVGDTIEEKLEVFSYLKEVLPPQTHLLTRSSWAGRTLLYPSLPTDAEKLFTKKTEVRPEPPIVNSIIILET